MRSDPSQNLSSSPDRQSPLISVVVPITRYEGELEEALESVFRQTFQDFEVILVDNLATPGTRAVANRWKEKNPDRVRIVEEPVKGAVTARNKGITESLGTYICLLDSDDRMMPHRLERQIKALKDNPEAVLAGSWSNEVSPDGKTVVAKDARPEIPRWANILFRHTKRGMEDPFYEPKTSTLFFRADVAREIGMFDLRFNPIWLEDTDFVFRMYEHGRIVVVPETLIDYRQHAGDDSARRIFDLGWTLNYGLFFSILREKYFVKGDRLSVESFQQLRSRWSRETGIKLLGFPNGVTVGRKLIHTAWKIDPFDLQNIEALIRSRLPRTFHPRPFRKKAPEGAMLPGFMDEAWASQLFSLEE